MVETYRAEKQARRITLTGTSPPTASHRPSASAVATFSLWVAGLACLTALAACAGEAPAGPRSAEDVLAAIAIAPRGPTLTAIGAIYQLTATGLDTDGQPVEGVEFRWSSSDEGVVTVSSAGVVTARGNGEATVRAEAADVSGRVVVSVEQRARSIEVSPPEATFGGPGARVRFEASGQDAGGHPVPPVLFTWTSSDEAVVTVDSAGWAVAHAPGQATVRASSGPTHGEALVEVGDEEPPTVLSVYPDPLLEGGEATISGQRFGARAPEEVRVTVDGVEAAVVAASDTEIRITVPAFDCRPARQADVAVDLGGFTTPAPSVTLRPGAPPLALEPGQQLLLQDPADFCLQFEGSAEDESYLVGIQSTSTLVSGLTEVRITSHTAHRQARETIALGEPTGVSAPAASVIAGSARAGRASSRGDSELRRSGDERPDVDARWRAHREAEARLRAWERAHLESLTPAPGALRSDEPGAAPPETEAPTVGDTLPVRVPHIRSGIACGSYTEVQALVRAVGKWGIWLEDPGNPSSGFGASDFEALSAELDGAIYDTNRTYFGAPTDLDGNDRILVLVTKEVNRTAPNTLGFVFGGDLFTRASCGSSDEGEIFYGRAPDPAGRWAAPFAVDEARGLYPRLIAHELTHVIQFGRRLAAGHPFMNTWMMEGQAMIAEEVVGHALTGRTTGSDYGFEVAFNHSGAEPVDWYRNGFTDMAFYFGYETGSSKVSGAPHECGWLRQNPEPCIGRALWYGVAWSFLRWASDHFGGAHPAGEAGFHRALVDSDRTGFENVSARTEEPVERMLAQWAASLYLDGRTEGLDRRLTLPSWDLHAIFGRLVPAARLQPLAGGFTDFAATGAVRAGSAAYLRLEAEGRPATALRVRNVSDEPVLEGVQFWVVRIR